MSIHKLYGFNFFKMDICSHYFHVVDVRYARASGDDMITVIT